MEVDDTLLFKSYSPGYLKQDIITFPIELGLTYALPRFYSKSAAPLWPFTHENPDASVKSTLISGHNAGIFGLTVSAGVFTGLKLFKPDSFLIYPNLSGLVHTVLLTDIASTFAKTFWLRKRPFFNSRLNSNGITSESDRFSFFSEHASQAFAFASYTSALVWQYSESSVVGAIYGSIAFSAATYVAASRVIDHSHNTSDVIVGAIVGSLIAFPVYFRVQNVIKLTKEEAIKSNSTDIEAQIIPIVQNDEKNLKNKFGFLFNFTAHL